MPNLPEVTRRLSRMSQAIQRPVPSVLRLDSIKSQMVVFALLAALIPALSMAVVSYIQNRRALTEKISEELRSLSTQTAREMDLWLKERLYDVKVFASSYEVVENVQRARLANPATALEAKTRLDAYVTSVQAPFTDYDELLVVDPTGAIVGTSAAIPGTFDLPDGWLADVASGRTVIGDPAWSTDAGRPIMAVAIPIPTPSRAFIGAMVARFNFSTVLRILQEYTPAGDGRVVLVDGAARIIVSSDTMTAEVMESHMDPAALTALLGGTNSVVRYADLEGRRVVGAGAQMPMLGWSAVAEVPARQAFRPIARLRNVTVLLVSALVLAIGLIAYRLGILIVRPLDRLTAGAAEVARGDLAVDLPDAGGGEVGYLTEVFNYMVARLRAGREKLDDATDELRSKNEELERLSVTDALTGLFNRRRLMDAIDGEVRRAERMRHPFAILMTDVDHFKSFNDTYGHQAGDEVLTRVAGVVKATVRDVDMAARYGGEEFSVLLPETDLDDAADVAERIRQRVAEERFLFGGKAVQVTLSIGVSEFPTDGATPEMVIEAADQALYQAKKRGRNRVVCAPRKSRARSKGA